MSDMSVSELEKAEKSCVFQCSDILYGLPAIDVKQVAPYPELTMVPHCDPIFQGLCHFRNEFIPVASLRAITQVQYEGTREEQMLVISGEKGSWGLLVDQVMGLEILEISVSCFSTQNNAWSSVSFGSATFKDQVVQILDSKALYRYTSGLLDMFWVTPEASKIN